MTESRPNRHNSPRPVPPRFSLQNRHIERDAYIDDIRQISYRNTSADLLALRERLIGQGLILGQSHVDHTGEQTFNIPKNVRPLFLEPPVRGESGLVYSDDRLVSDLGNITGQVARLTEGRIIQGPHAEDAFALTDFVDEGSRQVLLTPGAELWLSEQTYPPEDLQRLQMEQFSLLFGERFAHVVGYFGLGYMEGLAG